MEIIQRVKNIIDTDNMGYNPQVLYAKYNASVLKMPQGFLLFLLPQGNMVSPQKSLLLFSIHFRA